MATPQDQFKTSALSGKTNNQTDHAAIVGVVHSLMRQLNYYSVLDQLDDKSLCAIGALLQASLTSLNQKRK